MKTLEVEKIVQTIREQLKKQDEKRIQRKESLRVHRNPHQRIRDSKGTVKTEA